RSISISITSPSFIQTGGVGARRTPPVWMKDGDVIEIEIDRVGILRNTIAVD
ncbi:MAG: hypothetical protein EBT33_17240, partial [Betaproteobacteria bacterium]|nr:hypothetical protein [Betaproteobacteria bacterium]